jgi:hypothetical protein
VAWGAVLLAGFTVANGYLYLLRDDVYVETRPAYRHVAARLREDDCFGEGPLLVWGWAPMFYTETRLPPASRFLLVGFSLTGYVSGSRDPDSGRGLVDPVHWNWLLSDLARRRPTYVLDTAHARLGRWSFPLEGEPRLSALVAAGYETLDVVDHVRIYRRRRCRAPASSTAVDHDVVDRSRDLVVPFDQFQQPRERRQREAVPPVALRPPPDQQRARARMKAAATAEPSPVEAPEGAARRGRTVLRSGAAGRR